MSLYWQSGTFTLSHIISLNPPTRSLSITGHWNVSLPPGASPWMAFLGGSKGQNITDTGRLFKSLPTMRFLLVLLWSNFWHVNRVDQHGIIFVSLRCYFFTWQNFEYIGDTLLISPNLKPQNRLKVCVIIRALIRMNSLLHKQILIFNLINWRKYIRNRTYFLE